MYGVLLNPYHPLARGLVGCWLFNEGGGNTVFDLSGYGNHGTLGGGDSAKCPAWVPSRTGPALNFDGNDYVSLASTITLTDDWTTVVFFNINSVSDDHDMILGYHLSANCYIRVLDGTTIRVQSNVSGTYKDYTVPTISTHTWYHLAVTRRNGNVRVFLDGVESTSGSQAIADDFTFDQIARYYTYDTYSFGGMIDLVLIFNVAKTPEEIWQLYTDPFCMFYHPLEAELLYAAPAAFARSYGYIIG